MEPISYLPYFTPIIEDGNQDDPLKFLRNLDGLLSFGDRSAKVTLVKEKVRFVEFERTETTWKTTAFKVAFFASLILPAIALVAKVIYRAYHKFELASKENERERLICDNELKQIDIDKLENENEDLFSTNQELDENIKTLQESLTSKETELEDQKKINTMLQGGIEDLNEKNLASEKEIQSLQQTLTRERDKVTMLNTQINQISKKLEERNTQLMEIQLKFQALPKENDALKKEVEELKNQVNDLKTKEESARKNSGKSGIARIKSDALLRDALKENERLQKLLEEEIEKNLASSQELSQASYIT